MGAASSTWIFKVSLLVLLAVSAGWYGFGTYTGNFSKEQKIRYGPWAVVAGASEGLGAEWARQLAAQGLNVLLVARRQQQLRDVAMAIQNEYSDVTIATYQADLLSLTPQLIYERVQQKGERRIGLVVYNAMYTGQGRFDKDETVDALKKVINVNNMALLELIHPLVRHMKVEQYVENKKRGGGGVVLMSSMAGEAGVANFATYSASKAFITMLGRTLYFELKRDKIDVLSCIAGATLTPQYENMRAVTADSFIEQTPAQVVSECIAALGKTGTIATGPLNKVVRFVFGRLLPFDFTTFSMSEGAHLQMDFDKPNRQDLSGGERRAPKGDL